MLLPSLILHNHLSLTGATSAAQKKQKKKEKTRSRNETTYFTVYSTRLRRITWNFLEKKLISGLKVIVYVSSSWQHGMMFDIILKVGLDYDVKAISVDGRFTSWPSVESDYMLVGAFDYMSGRSRSFCPIVFPKWAGLVHSIYPCTQNIARRFRNEEAKENNGCTVVVHTYLYIVTFYV